MEGLSMNAGTVQFYATVFAFVALAVITVGNAARSDQAACERVYSADACFQILNR